MKKKIAYLGINQRGGFRRAEAFIKNAPQYDHTFVIFLEWNGESAEPAYKIPYENVRYILSKDFVFDEYDLVLHMNDKLFKHVLNNANLGLDDMADKQVMTNVSKKLGLPMLKESGFNDDEFVILKPVNSSGSYSAEPLAYQGIEFSKVKHFVGNSNYVIQEFVPTKDVIMFSTISNGKGTLFRCDVVVYEYVPDDKGQFFPQYMESKEHLISEYQNQFDNVEKFLRAAGYDKIPGIFNLQFVQRDGNFYLIDFNTRSGPVTTEAEVNNIMNPRVYRTLPFMLGETSIEKCVDFSLKFENYRLFATKDGKKLTEIEFTPSSKCVKISENKKSGCFRDDFDIYLEQSE